MEYFSSIDLELQGIVECRLCNSLGVGQSSDLARLVPFRHLLACCFSFSEEYVFVCICTLPQWSRSVNPGGQFSTLFASYRERMTLPASRYPRCEDRVLPSNRSHRIEPRRPGPVSLFNLPGQHVSTRFQCLSTTDWTVSIFVNRSANSRIGRRASDRQQQNFLLQVFASYV